MAATHDSYTKVACDVQSRDGNVLFVEVALCLGFHLLFSER